MCLRLNRTGAIVINIMAIPPNLAMRIYEGIASPKEYVFNGGWVHQVSGYVQLSHGGIVTKGKARCQFEVSPSWMEIIPRVKCYESWRAPGDPEWHIDNEGYLCTELGLRWVDEIQKTFKEKGFCAAADYAALWLLNSTATLLYRQQLRFRGVISRWQNRWNYWSHWTAGEDEYRLQKKTAQAVSGL